MNSSVNKCKSTCHIPNSVRNNDSNICYDDDFQPDEVNNYFINSVEELRK